MAGFAIESKRLSDSAVEIRCEFGVSREKVFRAWADPEWLASWLCPDGNAEVTIHDFDFRVGGTFGLRMLGPDWNLGLEGEYLEIRPPERLVFTWQWTTDDSTPVPTEVVVELEESEKGCAMTLRHSRFVTVEQTDRHREGWTACLGRLNSFIEQR